MKKIVFAVAAAAAMLALAACDKEPPVPVEKSTATEVSLVPEQASQVGEAQGAIRAAKTTKEAFAAYHAKTAGFTSTMRAQVDVVYDDRFASAVAEAKGDPDKIAVLREYIITFNNRGCFVKTECGSSGLPQ